MFTPLSSPPLLACTCTSPRAKFLRFCQDRGGWKGKPMPPIEVPPGPPPAFGGRGGGEAREPAAGSEPQVEADLLRQLERLSLGPGRDRRPPRAAARLRQPARTAGLFEPDVITKAPAAAASGGGWPPYPHDPSSSLPRPISQPPSESGMSIGSYSAFSVGDSSLAGSDSASYYALRSSATSNGGMEVNVAQAMAHWADTVAAIEGAEMRRHQ